MYLPRHFRQDDLATLHALIDARPLATLVSQGPDGLQANPLPVLRAAGLPGPAGLGVLQAHVARANPQRADLARGGTVLLVFQGEQAYVSPGWYPSKASDPRVVPTWNYSAVHVWARPRLIEEADWLRTQVTALTARHEAARHDAARSTPWTPEDAPADYLAAMLRGIVGLELEIERIEGKDKLSQNRPAVDRQGVIAALDGGDAAQRATAERMRRVAPPDPAAD